VVMIESPEGVASCEEIAAVKGIDALLVGTNDLCFEMGVPGKFDDPRVAEAYKKVIAACRKHGKFPGMGGMYTPELLERYVNMGVQLVLSGSDFSLLMQAGTQRASLVRGFEKKSCIPRPTSPARRRRYRRFFAPGKKFLFQRPGRTPPAPCTPSPPRS